MTLRAKINLIVGTVTLLFVLGLLGLHVRDLRASVFLDNPAWFDIVLRGAMSGIGMASFGSVLDEDDAGAIRAHVIRRANEDRQAAAAVMQGRVGAP